MNVTTVLARYWQKHWLKFNSLPFFLVLTLPTGVDEELDAEGGFLEGVTGDVISITSFELKGISNTEKILSFSKQL